MWAMIEASQVVIGIRVLLIVFDRLHIVSLCLAKLLQLLQDQPQTKVPSSVERIALYCFEVALLCFCFFVALLVFLAICQAFVS